MQTRSVEIWVGVFMLIGMAALFFLAMKVSNFNQYAIDEGYTVEVRFSNVGGLKVRSPVTVSGVRVGQVESINYDQDEFEAVVMLKIDSSFDQFPTDTSASIFTSGLLGEQYVGLEPGADDESLQDGDEIRISQSAIVLEQIIGQFLFSKAAE